MGNTKQHTAGPWKRPIHDTRQRVDNGPWTQRISGATGGAVAHVTSVGYPQEFDANAKLIAAAPGLLEACEAALDTLRVRYDNDTMTGPEADVEMLVRNAINKATA